MNVRGILFALCVLAFLLGAPPLASAQSSDRLANLDIHVWPEFDDPRVLVQFDGELSTTGSYPHEVSFYIPIDAELLATAYADESKTLFNTEAATVTDAGGGFKRVTFTIPKSHFHLEYYHDAIKGSPDKTFDFVYKALLPADQVRLQIQQPLKSEKFTTSPAAALQSEGQHGFKYHIFNLAALNPDQELKVLINYTKTDPNPSVQNIIPPETTPETAPETAELISPPQLALVIGIGIALGLAALAFLMWYRQRQPSPAFARARDKASRGANPGGYCWQCGSPMHVEDNFCAQCGAKRR